jgi:hypothetical protein
VLRNSKLPVTMFLTCLCNCIRLVAEVSTMGGGLPVLLVEGYCSSVSGLLVVSSTTSISDVLRGANKFLVGT